MNERRSSRKLAVAGVVLILAALLTLLLGSSVAWAGGPFGGMMGNWCSGGMMVGPGGMMVGPLGQRYLGGANPISIDRATQAVRDYLAAGGNTDLVPTEIMEFERNFYAEVKEKGTGVHAFELLVDKNTGAVYPEMGPNMMWNTKYGMMSSMMGSFRAGAATADMPVGPDQAKQLAQQYLDRNFPGSTTEEPDTFYGYHTVHTVKDGRVTGMLSVQGYTGSVWYHSWHGPFVQMKELE